MPAKDKKSIVTSLADPEPKKHVMKFSNDAADAPLSSLYLSRQAIRDAGHDPDKVKEVTVTIDIKAA